MPKPDEVGRRHADAATAWRRFAWPCHPSNHVRRSTSGNTRQIRVPWFSQGVQVYSYPNSLTQRLRPTGSIPPARAIRRRSIVGPCAVVYVQWENQATRDAATSVEAVSDCTL